MTDYIIYFFSVLSVVLNIILILKIRNYKTKPRPPSLELTEFIRDLTSGKALITCHRVDTDSVFLRSQRGR